MQILSYTLGIYICTISLLVSGCDELIHSETLSFHFTQYYNSFWNNENRGMLILYNQDSVTQHQNFAPSNEDIDVNYDTHFVIFYFSGAGDGISLPEKQELVRVERIADTISLHYDYEGSEGIGPDAEFSPMDVIQVEKSEQFRWDDVLEILVYYNESEVIRESVDFSTSYAIFLPLIQASNQSKDVF